MGEVWGIGKRRFGKDWIRRIWLFDESVMGYGIEIWKERKRVEKMQERFIIKMSVGVDGRTSGYMIREEVQREKLRSRAGKKA